MAKKRVTRKQLLKEPDEFITTTGRLIAWAKENTQKLTIGAGVFFVLIIVVSVFGYYHDKRTNSAQLMFSQVVAKYQAEAGQKTSAEALSAVSEDLDLLVGTYGGTPAGKLGRVFYGHICVAGKAYDKAIEYYSQALDDFSSGTPLTNVILNGLAMAYQQKGTYPQAIESYRRLADGPGSILKDAALFNLGKLYGQLGQLEESRQAYQRLNTEFPGSMYANIVREKIAGQS